MINNALAWFFANTSLIAFGFAILLGIIGFVKRANSKKGHVWEPLEFWMLFLFVGLVGVYTFALHCFWPDLAAEGIGWKNSPFQWEVGIANAWPETKINRRSTEPSSPCKQCSCNHLAEEGRNGFSHPKKCR